MSDTKEFIVELKKAAKCVFLAAEESVAQDLSDKLNKAATTLANQQDIIDKLVDMLEQWLAVPINTKQIGLRVYFRTTAKDMKRGMETSTLINKVRGSTGVDDG